MAPSPCRLLIANERDTRHPRAGGAELHVAEIFGRLAARGYTVTLAASSFPGAAPEEDVDGLRVLRLGSVPRYYPAVARRIATETRNGRVDVVVECLNKVPFYSPLYSRAPVLALCHHLFGETAFRQVAWPIAAAVWSAERFIPRVYGSQQFVTISASSRSDLIARGIDADRIEVNLCGIRRPSLRASTEVMRPPRIVYLGRLERYKRVDVLLRAAQKLIRDHPTLEVLVIGRGTAEKQLRALASELGLGDRVQFTGFVTDEERDQMLASCRVCACPSEREGWGLTVIEANAVATPVVASDAPGLRDSVRDERTGFLVPVGDVAALAERIDQLLRDDTLWQRIAVEALAWSQRFDWDTAASEMAEAIERARGQ